MRGYKQKPRTSGAFGKESYLWLTVAVVGEVAEQAANTEFANVFLGGFGRNFQLLGNGKIGFAVELGRQVVEKSLLDNRLTVGGFGGWQHAKHIGGVLKKYTSHSDGCLKIGIVADDEV